MDESYKILLRHIKTCAFGFLNHNYIKLLARTYYKFHEIKKSNARLIRTQNLLKDTCHLNAVLHILKQTIKT